jgi:hypothetical protein
VRADVHGDGRLGVLILGLNSIGTTIMACCRRRRAPHAGGSRLTRCWLLINMCRRCGGSVAAQKTL